MSHPVTVERRGAVLMIGVNRPEKRNAFNLATIDAFGAAYEQLADDPEVRVAVVFGHGDHFSAGLDLAEVGPAVAEKGPAALGGGHRFDPWGMWGPQVQKPVVLAVSGISYTLTIELALASDIVIASETVRFRQLEISRGIIPFGGATMRAAARLGWGNAMRFLLTAEEFGAAEALRIGLVQEVTPPGKQIERAQAIAEMIARQAPLGVQGTLANARTYEAQGAAAALEHLRSMLPRLMTSEDAMEGMQSFIERREAAFKGR
jgi:enoyl-CoA hydratase/carnithine racemase